MYINHKISIEEKLFAIFLLAFLVLGGAFVWLSVNMANAAALTSVSDTLSTPSPGASSTHEILFVTPTGALTSTQTITIELDTTNASFTIPENFNEDDIDLQVDDDAGCDGPYTHLNTTSSAAAADTWSITVNTSTDIITFEHPSNNSSSDSIQPNRCVRILLGTNASSSGSSDADIQNPAKVAAEGTADVFTIGIAGTFPDSGNAMVAIIEGVTITATVAESLSFAIAGVAGGSCTQGGDASSTITTTVTSTPFGTIGTGFTKGCQDLVVGTNASSGYIISGQEDQELTSGGNTIPNTTCDGSVCTNTATGTWVTATNEGFGYSCDPAGSSDDCDSAFTTSTDYRSFSTSTAITVITRNSPTPNGDSTSRIIYKITVAANQAAGTYSNVVTWIATPTF